MSDLATSHLESQAIDRVARSILDVPAGVRRLMLFDFDGTLCELIRDPEAVWLAPERRVLLERLAERSDTTVGVVSGRRLEDVRRRVGLDGRLYYAGLHGLEIEGEGLSFVHQEVSQTQGLLQVIRRSVQALTSEMPNVLVEDKNLSIALHVRGATPAHQAEAEAAFFRVAGPHLDSGLLRLQRGNCVFELLPNIDWNKGTAVRKLMDDVAGRFRQPLSVAYLGDDLTDEHAFEVLGEEGITIVVGDRPSSARFRLRDPGQVEELLRRLV